MTTQLASLAPEAQINIFTRELYPNPVLNSLAPKQFVAVVEMASGDRPFMQQAGEYPSHRSMTLEYLVYHFILGQSYGRHGNDWSYPTITLADALDGPG